METIKRAAAIKEYMGSEKPVTLVELKELMLQDRDSFNWMAQECAKMLGKELEAY